MLLLRISALHVIKAESKLTQEPNSTVVSATDVHPAQANQQEGVSKDVSQLSDRSFLQGFGQLVCFGHFGLPFRKPGRQKGQVRVRNDQTGPNQEIQRQIEASASRK